MNQLNEIVAIAKQGLEHSILSQDSKSKEMFLEIIVKAELFIHSQHNCLVDDNLSKSTDIMENDTRLARVGRFDVDTKHDMYVIAYCFSEYEHDELYPRLNQGMAFDSAADILGVKMTTLRNTRDAFDGHNDSSRRGWWQKPLSPDMQEFKQAYSVKNKNDILVEARRILGQEP